MRRLGEDQAAGAVDQPVLPAITVAGQPGQRVCGSAALRAEARHQEGCGWQDGAKGPCLVRPCGPGDDAKRRVTLVVTTRRGKRGELFGEPVEQRLAADIEILQVAGARIAGAGQDKQSGPDGIGAGQQRLQRCLLYTSPSPRDS